MDGNGGIVWLDNRVRHLESLSLSSKVDLPSSSRIPGPPRRGCSKLQPSSQSSRLLSNLSDQSCNLLPILIIFCDNHFTLDVGEGVADFFEGKGQLEAFQAEKPRFVLVSGS
ncbi:hypothetical protein ACFX2J_012542 [Malus domestica]